jgi:hypothetical protein
MSECSHVYALQKGVALFYLSSGFASPLGQGSQRRAVLVAQRQDVVGMELLTWALVKAAGGGDPIIVLHVAHHGPVEGATDGGAHEACILVVLDFILPIKSVASQTGQSSSIPVASS